MGSARVGRQAACVCTKVNDLPARGDPVTVPWTLIANRTSRPDGASILRGTRGHRESDVAHKDRAARIWCEDATLLTGAAWSYLKVPQKEFEKLQPSGFADILVFEA